MSMSTDARFSIRTRVCSLGEVATVPWLPLAHAAVSASSRAGARRILNMWARGAGGCSTLTSGAPRTPDRQRRALAERDSLHVAGPGARRVFYATAPLH